jgi:hypothetical protein
MCGLQQPSALLYHTHTPATHASREPAVAPRPLLCGRNKQQRTAWAECHALRLSAAGCARVCGCARDRAAPQDELEAVGGYAERGGRLLVQLLHLCVRGTCIAGARACT